MDTMTLNVAKQLLAAAVHKAAQIGIRGDVAIVDGGGNLVAFYRMDHARTGDIDIAIDKAWSSVALRRPTAELAKNAQPGGEAFGIHTTNNGRLVILGGGIPLWKQSRLMGGVGVSGGTSAQDIEAAEAAVSAFHNLISLVT
ncbi:heme-binding protein [Paenibacillus cellulosilyticus]|nr:heme-binding protein [Paenibacillus cellulosilyticus]